MSDTPPCLVCYWKFLPKKSVDSQKIDGRHCQKNAKIVGDLELIVSTLTCSKEIVVTTS